MHYPQKNTDVPAATEIHTDNDQVPTATTILDWDILQKRMVWHLNMAVDIVVALFKQADRNEVRADLIQLFGWVAGSSAMHESADKERAAARDLRRSALKVGASYFAIALGVETTRWLVEQGLVKQAGNAIANTSRSVWHKISNLFSWSANATNSASVPLATPTNDQQASAPLNHSANAAVATITKGFTPSFDKKDTSSIYPTIDATPIPVGGAVLRPGMSPT